MNGRQDDRAARMHGDIDLIADFDPGEVHQRGIKDDALGISDFGNGFGHDVILCFTQIARSNAKEVTSNEHVKSRAHMPRGESKSSKLATRN